MSPFLLDVNGDGLADIIKRGISPSGFTGVYINTGDQRWVKNDDWQPPVFFDRPTGDNGVRFADVNGDGLVDIVQALTNQTVGFPIGADHGVYLNTGEGWAKSDTWRLPEYLHFSHREAPSRSRSN